MTAGARATSSLGMGLVLCLLVGGCVDTGPAEEARTGPGVVRQAATYGQTWNHAGGIAGTTGTYCPLCGRDYACMGGFWTWNGQLPFSDPTPPASRVTSVTVNALLGCNQGGVTVYLNNTLLGTWAGSSTPSCSCGSSNCFSRSLTLTNAAGIPGYVYGGTNVLRYASTSFCVLSTTVTLGTVDSPLPTATPGSLTFATVDAGSSAPSQRVTVQNTGAYSVVLSSSTTTPPFTLSGPGPNTVLLPDASVGYDVGFSPGAGGSFSGSLDFATSVGPLAVSLSGTALGGRLQLTTASFPDTRVGDTSAGSVLVENLGNGPLTVTGLLDGGVFRPAAGALPLTLGVGASQPLALEFSPTWRGPNVRTVFLSAPPLAPVGVELSGNGIGPVLAVAPTQVTFPNTAVGASSASAVQLLNLGETPLTVSGYQGASTGFTLTGPTPPFTVAPDAGATLTATFTPTTDGLYTGTLPVSSDSLGPAATVRLVGRGVAPRLGSAHGNFGRALVGSSRVGTISFSNQGGTLPLTVSSVTLSGAQATEFAVTGTLPLVIPAGATGQLAGEFRPAAVGTRTADLTITHDGLGATTGLVTGIGTEARLTASANVNFGTVQVGATRQRTFTLGNTGSDTLVVSAFTLAGPNGVDFAAPASLPLSVDAGASVVLPVTFSPQGIGAHAATLGFTSNAANPGVVTALAGTGVAEPLLFTPSPLDFGVLALDGGSIRRTLTLQNVGAGAVSLTALSLADGDAGITVDPVSLPRSIAAGSGLSLDVRAAPRTVGAQSDLLTAVTQDGGTAQVVVTVTGNAGALYAAPLDFGAQLVGVPVLRTVRVRNLSTTSRSVTATTISGPNAADFASTGSFVVGGGASVDRTVTWIPSTDGPAEATITFAAGADSTSTVLTGTGLAGGGAVDGGSEDGGGGEDAGPGGSEDAGPGGSEDAGPGGSEDAGAGGSGDAGASGNEDAGAGGNEDAGAGGNEDAGAGGSGDAGGGAGGGGGGEDGTTPPDAPGSCGCSGAPSSVLWLAGLVFSLRRRRANRAR